MLNGDVTTAVGGMAEAATVDVISTQAGVLKFNPLRTVGITFGGGVIASAVQKSILTTSLKSKRGGEFVSGFAEAAAVAAQEAARPEVRPAARRSAFQPRQLAQGRLQPAAGPESAGPGDG